MAIVQHLSNDRMLVVFICIYFVADTKLIYGNNFVAPLILKYKFHIVTPWQLSSIFHPAFSPIFESFEILNSTLFENLKMISLLNLSM